MLGPLEPPSLEHALPKLTHITPRNDNARSAILSTLSLLDFRISDWFPSGPSNTESEDMVLQLFPGKSFAANPKVFEAVTYFLFTKLDKERARDVFRTCWPIFDRSQAREFRNTVVKALEMMKKDGVLPQTLLIRRSCFDDLRGERYEQTLLSLAVHVLNTVMSREYSSSVDDPFLHMDLSRKHDHHVLLQCLEKLDAFSKEFGALQDLRHSTEQEWIKYGQEITHAFEEVTRDMVDCAQ
ncbi:HAUS augmin-like complex subunit 6 N-terminus-domain-containing protein [Chytridium lagenaria]|nr:HAUS augmin-like complex subunit 6 N-terminus-domain-containing protein [Chytridium lagenaria]